MLRHIIIIATLLWSAIALAQSIGGNQGIGIRIGGATGSGGGGGGGNCLITTQLDASNACNLIGLMTGT